MVDNMRAKIFIIIFSIIIGVLIWTKNLQNAYIDTKLLKIPINCLDANNDGEYNSLDFNYGGINIYLPEKESFMLMDKKGAASQIRKCVYVLPKNFDMKYLTDTNCIGYCRFFAWIKYKFNY